MDKNECISFGTCHKKYCFITTAQVALILIIAVLTVAFQSISSQNEEEKLEQFVNIIVYLFFNNLCESSTIILDLILKKIISSPNTNINSLMIKRINYFRKHIFKNNSTEFTKKEKIYFIIFVFLKLIIDSAFIFFLYFIIEACTVINLISYTFHFELIFLFLLSKILYNIQFYKHQYFSIVILAIISFAKLIYNNIERETGNFFLIFFYDLFYHHIKLVTYLEY